MMSIENPTSKEMSIQKIVSTYENPVSEEYRITKQDLNLMLKSFEILDDILCSSWEKHLTIRELIPIIHDVILEIEHKEFNELVDDDDDDVLTEDIR